MLKFRIPAVLTAIILLMGVAWAQTSPPTRVRGVIASVGEHAITVNARDGARLDITLNEPLTVMAVKRVDLASITPNTYVGIASRTAADGKPEAIEVLVFPEAMRGTGEGHYAWDLEPG
ncbi:MAG: hypothetical protein JO227_17365, partial [Acetobacteraceae bacterium]|nr:hypothetical protein [Acetobacteraceae bacterium]